jgi:hypothetical protein
MRGRPSFSNATCSRVSCIALFAAWAAAGCGDATPGSSGGDTDAGSEGDACVNEEDLEILDEQLAEVVNASLDCLWNCHTLAAPASCAAECMSDDTGLSVECSACWAEYGICVSELCQDSCAVDAPEGECAACTEEHCHPQFEACAGVAMY